VAVPEEVVDLLADLRGHQQDKCEPPVYVSDRRLVKAVALMQARGRAPAAPARRPALRCRGRPSARVAACTRRPPRPLFDYLCIGCNTCMIHRGDGPLSATTLPYSSVVLSQCTTGERTRRPARRAQVAAFTSGRAAVSRFDCLLLQHVLWQRPDEAPRIADWLVARLAVGDSLKSLDYSFAGARPALGAAPVQAAPFSGSALPWAGVFSGVHC